MNITNEDIIIKTIDKNISKLHEACEDIKKSDDISFVHQMTTASIIELHVNSMDLLRSYKFSSQEEYTEIRVGKEKQLIDALVKISQISSLKIQELSGESEFDKEFNDHRQKVIEAFKTKGFYTPDE